MNPEFQRNLWLEASPRRLIWAAVVVALVYGAALLISSTENDGRPGARVEALGGAGAFVFVVAMLWSAREASRSVLTEIGERTWEFQRLSALSPWDMTWGKLLGATSVAWLAALSGLALAAAAAAAKAGGVDALALGVSGVAGMALLQALALSSALIAVRKARADGRLSTMRGFGGGILWIVLALVVLNRLFAVGFGDNFPDDLGAQAPRHWWEMAVPAALFVPASLVAFAAWAVAAAWRLMRLELQMENSPLAWIGFLLFAAFYFAGLQEDAADRWAAVLAVGIAGSYVGAFTEPADRIRLRQFARDLRAGEAERWSTKLPAVIPALLLAFAALAGLTGTGGLIGDEPGRGALAAAALLAFLVRDLAVIAWCRFGPRPHRGDMAAVLALALLYGVGGMVGLSSGAGPIGSLFHPFGEQSDLSLFSGLVMAAIALALAWRRMRMPETSSIADARP